MTGRNSDTKIHIVNVLSQLILFKSLQTVLFLTLQIKFITKIKQFKDRIGLSFSLDLECIVWFQYDSLVKYKPVLKKNPKTSVMAQVFNFSTPQAKAGRSEFQTSQGYIPYLKKQTKMNPPRKPCVPRAFYTFCTCFRFPKGVWSILIGKNVLRENYSLQQNTFICK